MAEQSESTHKSQRRTGLGRGLGALIPPAQTEKPEDVAKRPLDVLFPGERKTSGTVRGGSARELLEPKSRTAKSVSAKSKSSAQAKVRAHTAASIGSDHQKVEATSGWLALLLRLNLQALLVPRKRNCMRLMGTLQRM